MNLCARVNFKARRIERNGAGIVGFVSAHRTQVNNKGGCQRITAEFVLDPPRGVFGLAMMSEGQLCYGGFAPVDGAVTGCLRGVLRGRVVIFYSVTDCVPLLESGDRATVCDDPIDTQGLCYDDAPSGGKDCIYCVPNTATEQPVCTIEQDVTYFACKRVAFPSGIVEPLLPLGARVVPHSGMYDVYGDDEEFRAKCGREGRVKYYLQDAIRLKVDPLYFDQQDPEFCARCAHWLCATILHNLSAGTAWDVICTEVFKEMDYGSIPGACCVKQDDLPWGYGEILCFDGGTEAECAEACQNAYGGRWAGPGSQCGWLSEVYFSPYPRGRCCLPDGLCNDLTESDCAALSALGARWLGYGDECKLDDWKCEGATYANLALRNVELVFGQAPIGVVQFNYGAGQCFRLWDNGCFSTGPDTDACGGDPCWSHLNIGVANDRLVRDLLDRIRVDADMRFGSVDRYPHVEPHCVGIANQVLEQVNAMSREVVHELSGVTKATWLPSYDQRMLNYWWSLFRRPCAEAPVVCGVDVLPYKADCVFPADLVISEVGFHLWLSADPKSYEITDSPGGNPARLRVAAYFECVVTLKIRLQAGWDAIECDVGIVNAPHEPCDPVLTDPERYMIIAGGACTHVPRRLTWRGFQGPRPWSKGPFDFENLLVQGETRGMLLCAIDGMVVPGEINDTSDVDGSQRYDGDVVLLLPPARESYCQCVGD